MPRLQTGHQVIAADRASRRRRAQRQLRDALGRFRRREACGRGVCAALEGHEGTCDEASGWVTLDRTQASGWYRQGHPRDLTTGTGGLYLGGGGIGGATAYTTGAITVTPAQHETWTTWTTAPYQPPTSAGIWPGWLGASTTNYTINLEIQNGVWDEWNNMGIDMVAQEEAARMMEERHARQRAEHDRHQREREEASRRRLAAAPLIERAQSRAYELLELILTEEEKLYRENHDGEVLIRGGDTGKLYVVDTEYHGVHGNIWETDEHGCKLARLCVSPEMYHRDEHGDAYGMPLADGYIGQILSIRHNEQALIRRANYSAQRPCRHPGVPVLGDRRVA